MTVTTIDRSERIPCAVLGATGLVGQTFVWLLARHPRFQPVILTTTRGRNGMRLGREVQWRLPFPPPDTVSGLPLSTLDVDDIVRRGVRVVFSALPGDVAARVETALRSAGCLVFTNAGALRGTPGVPIVIPEINAHVLDALVDGVWLGRGAAVANSNCTVSGLALALAPLREYGIRRIDVATYQSISGAGYPGVSSIDIEGSVVPFIPGEEDKVAGETRALLEIDADIHATCVRVPVRYGHIEAVTVTFEQEVPAGDILAAWERFGGENGVTGSLPARPVRYHGGDGGPQPQMAFWGDPPGMEVFTGRLRVRAAPRTASFVVLVNNLVRGAAGGSVANAVAFLERIGEEAWTASS
jgi:aspartate-semialdehyde dehydrogenase